MPRTVARAAAALVSVAALSACGAGAGATGTALAAPAQAPPEARSVPTVTAVGEGTSSAAPDVLHADVGVEVAAEQLSAAFAQAADAAQRVVDELRERGVAAEDIQTSDLSVRDQRAEPPPAPAAGPPEVTGYVVRHMLHVTIRDVDGAPDVLAGVVEAGGEAARVRGLRFALDDDGAVQQQARERAVEDARATAEQYAELLGRDLGDVVSLGDVGTGPVPPAAGGTAAEAAPPLQPGQSTVSVRVQGTWELE